MTSSTDTAAQLRIDFLFLDLETCTRCRGTGRSLDAALETTRAQREAAGVTAVVHRTLVDSAERARELRFVSSPTIRIGGRDIAPELGESTCGSEACTDGCGESIACRVWTHDGVEHNEPPVALIVEAILRALHQPAPVADDGHREPFRLPENLERFFAAPEPPASSGCCPPAEQASCCAPAAKAGCCGAAHGDVCGCR